MTRLASLGRALAMRRFTLVAAVLGILLVAPSIPGGFQTEDWVFRDVARATPVSLENFNLWGGDGRLPERAIRERVRGQRQRGLTPWVTSEAFSVSFFRPLASLTHRLEFSLYPNRPALMHLQNVLWYGLTILAAGLLYRRLLARAWVAGLATLLYAVDDAHGHPVGWISNRNALIGASLSLLAIAAHDRWRRDGWRAGAWLAPSALGLGLLGSELALGAVGYLVAHAVFIDRASRPRRLAASLPWLVVVAAWALGYHALGHGVSGSGLYLDPLHAPGDFVTAGAARVVVLLASAFGGPPADLYSETTSLSLVAIASLAVLIVIVVAMAATLGRDRVARFWALGTALSALPVIAAFPEDRLLLLTGAGALALVARFSEVAFSASSDGASGARRAARAVAGLLLVVHLVAAPLLLPFRSLTMARYEARLARARESAYALAPTQRNTLVVLDAPDFYFATMMLLTRISSGHSPAPTLIVTGTLAPVSVTGVTDDTLDVRVAGSFLAEPFNRIYRDASHPMRVGETTNAPAALITVTEIDHAGRPVAARFHFNWPVSGGRLVFARWRAGQYERVAPPAPGQTLIVKAR
ncbi:MAG: hypothetical protein OZ921_11575 [Sorangiineae bacterium]|nr:hypothetical protein [Polyangiaceae bacterium]MEB2323146.1 hypothetical protein [Sorangiineae bacterium]